MKDIRNLILSVRDLDEEYLEEWAGKLDLAVLLREIRS